LIVSRLQEGDVVGPAYLDGLERCDGDDPRPQVEPELREAVPQPQGDEVSLGLVVLRSGGPQFREMTNEINGQVGMNKFLSYGKKNINTANIYCIIYPGF
jgi:hypothetical protein